MPIVYEVDRIRDGKSFTTRRCNAIQHGQAIFSLSAWFQMEEPGLEHAFEIPDVAAPESLPSVADLLADAGAHVPETVRRYFERERPIELRPVDSSRYFQASKETPPAYVQRIWV